MKQFVTFVMFLTFCLVESLAKSILTQDVNSLVDLTLISGALSNNISAQVNIYGINSPRNLTLPITNADKHTTYIEYELPAQSQSYNPIWNQLALFPDDQFNMETQIAIELWDQQSPGKEKYIGGSIFTIFDLEHQQHAFNLVLNDNQQQVVAIFRMFWNK